MAVCDTVGEAARDGRGEEEGATTGACFTSGDVSTLLWFFKSSSSLSPLLPSFGAVGVLFVFGGAEED